MIGRRHVSMGPDHKTHSAIEIVPERLFLAGRLGMNIDHDCIGLFPKRTRLDFSGDCREGIVKRVHENAPHHIDDKDPRAVACMEQICAPTRSAGRKVGWADQPWLPFDEDKGLTLIPGMVAECDNIGASVDKILADLLADAEPTGGVFAIYRDEIDPIHLYEAWKLLGSRIPTGATYNVA